MNRREFLRLTGTFFAAASLDGIAGCGGGNGSSVDAAPDALVAGAFKFPQGVASGDPRTASVVLWTRAVPMSGTADVPLRVDVASDSAFATVVVMQNITATATSDHTVRVIVTGLSADTIYYYRFTAGLDTISGRTRTAPSDTADVPIRMAWASCQDYSAGQYHSYRKMVEEDMARAEADQVRFVLHLGDFIYETRGDGFQGAIDDNFQPITVNNPDGSPRTVPAFPSGGGTVNGTTNFAKTVDDYRHLYKIFASDPDSQAARARWPFVSTWDDHEFTDDCWQSMANYTNAKSLDEPSQARRYAANQAWFEYVPSQLTGSMGVAGVTQDAHDFTAASVSDAPFTDPNADNLVPEANNLAAIGSITIYRSLRFGKHCEVVLTDLRSHRSDHAVPEDVAAGEPEYFNPRNVVPFQDVQVCDAGAGAANQTLASGTPNPRATSPVGTMLGKTQKQWWKDTMKGSDATWKVWGNEVPFMRFYIQNSTGTLLADRVMDADAWDGYPSEQRELTQFLKDNNVKNVVILSGDIHAQYAGTVSDDFASASPTTIATEFIAAGISSNSVFSFYESASRGGNASLVRGLITVDDSATGGSKFTENMNMLLIHGTTAAATYAQTHDKAMALAKSDRTINPHLQYSDSNAQGYGVALFTASQVQVVLTTVERPITNTAGIKRTASFTVPKDNPAGMTGPVVAGTPPFPM